MNGALLLNSIMISSPAGPISPAASGSSAILAQNGSEVVDILSKSGAGIGTSVKDSKALALAILSILDNPEEAQKKGGNGVNYFLHNFERKKITMQWKEVLEWI